MERKGDDGMEQMKIRPAVQADLDEILKIYESARRYMAVNGNPTQWVNGYPRQELLLEDIRLQRLYAVLRDDIICGAFVFFIGEDPTYAYIEGAWGLDTPYGVIHRIAGIGGGVFTAALDYCRTRISHMRIDTHSNNKTMQHVVEKAGFVKRGIIYVEDGSPRIAYEMA